MNVHAPAPAAIPFPAGMCCNCGVEGAELRSAPLAVSPYLRLGGSERAVPALLPACAGCVPSLARYSPGFAGAFLAFAVWLGLAFIAAMAIQAGLDRPVGRSAFAAALVVGLGIPGAWYGLRRPRGAQTSFYQPVRLLRLRQRFSGEVRGATLGFTNPAYARAFAAELGVEAPPARRGLTRIAWAPERGL